MAESDSKKDTESRTIVISSEEDFESLQFRSVSQDLKTEGKIQNYDKLIAESLTLGKITSGKTSET
jgi:hypothetical protein